MKRLLLIVLPLLLIVGCEKNGFHTEYYENGKKKREGNIKEGKRDGQWFWYYNDGGMKKFGNFIDGEQIGDAILFDESGKKY